MKYIWSLIQEERTKQKKYELSVAYSDITSWIEVRSINENKFLININLRLYDIFEEYCEWLNIKNRTMSLNEIEAKLGSFENRILHILGDMDLIRGRNIKEELIREIIGYIKEETSTEVFSQKELKILAHAVYRLRKTGMSKAIFKEVLDKIFGNCYLYSHKDNSYISYIGTKKSEQNEIKLEIIKNFFLDIECTLEVFWEYHFGILGIDETMILEKIKLY
ncbi:hypothetical protein [Cetobacterium somerae]